MYRRRNRPCDLNGHIKLAVLGHNIGHTRRNLRTHSNTGIRRPAGETRLSPNVYRCFKQLQAFHTSAGENRGLFTSLRLLFTLAILFKSSSTATFPNQMLPTPSKHFPEVPDAFTYSRIDLRVSNIEIWLHVADFLPPPPRRA
jgi:hypothetical protein